MASRLDFSQIRSLYIGTSAAQTVPTNNLIIDGNVLIGTTTDNGDKLQVAGNTTVNGSLYLRGGSRSIVGDGGDLFIDTEDVAGRDVLIQSASGINQKVGIGTTAPQTGVKLDVYGAAAVAGGSEGLRIGNVGDNSAYDNVKIYYSGYNSGAPRVYLTPRTTPGSGVIQSYFHLLNSNGSSGASNNTMGLLVDGNVGIGTTSPSTPLQVSATSTLSEGVLSVINTHAAGGVYYPAARFVNQRGNHSYGIVAEFLTGSTSGTDRPSILFNTDISAKSWQVGMVTGDGNWGTNDWFGIGYRANNLPATFNTFPSARLLITDGGNVLIGTITDSGDKLHVIGNAVITTGQFGLATNTLRLQSSSGDTRSVGQFVGDEAVYNTASNTNTVNGSVAGIKFNWYSENWMISATRGGGADIYGLVISRNGTERLVINATGEVGIGTTTPGARLQLGNGGSDAELLRLSIGYDGSRSARGGINWHDGSSTTGRIYTEYDSTMTSMVFGSLYNSGYNSNNLMIIRGNGNVGIGTTGPAQKLQVVGNAWINRPSNKIDNANCTEFGGRIDFNNAFASNQTGYVSFRYPTYNNFLIGSDYDGNLGGAPPNIQFGLTNGSAVHMQITASTGNVLIGTTTDSGFKLRVNGEIYADDDIRIPNTFAIGLNGTDTNWRIGRNTITDTGWLTSNTLQIVVFGSSSGQGFQVVNSNGTALFEIDGVQGYTRITATLGVGVNPSGTTGRIDAANDIVAYSSSDLRLKENIKPIENALDKVKALTGVEFDWKPEHKEAHGYEGHDTGVIAQEVQEVMPTAVRTNDTGYLAVRYEKLIGLLIEAVKEQQAEIDELKKLIK